MGPSAAHHGPEPEEYGLCRPRNPRFESTIGQARDRRDKGKFMKITRVFKSTLVAMVMAGALLLTAPAAAHAAVFVGVGIAPPAIPVYAQPIAPGYGYIWTPGYWAYGPDGYDWVDGAWVDPPYVGALWTPGYWGWGVGGYFWYPGYWGRTVGYYGGINYGFGYFGVGFWGGYWNGGHYFYNGAYNHLGFHNGFVYNHPVAGFDGRPGGAAFARAGGNVAVNRGAGVNGNSSAANRGNVGSSMTRPGYNPGNTGAAHTFAGNSTSTSRAGAAAPQARSGGGSASGGFHGGGGGGGHAGGGGHR
jgi:uncharacterized membrane protein YgcG